MINETASAGRAEAGPGRGSPQSRGSETPHNRLLDAVRLGRMPGLAAGLVLGAFCLRLPWLGDLGLHLATARRFAEDLAHPVDPMVGTATPSPYFSPLTLIEGALVDWTGLSAHAVLSAVAIFACVLLFSGLSRFVRAAGGGHWSGPVAGACLLLLWGPVVFAWSGYPSLNSLALTVAYPSTVAMGLTLHLWVRVRRQALEGAEWWALPGTGLALGTVALVHQFTGATAAIGCLAMVWGPLWRRPAGRARAAEAGFGILVIAALVVTVWPYYDFWALGNTAAALDPVHQELYRQLPQRFGLATLGLPALAVRWRRDRTDPLVLLLGFSASVYVTGFVTGHWAYGRVWPGVMLALQMALAAELPRLGRWAKVLTAAALAVGLWAQAGAVGYILPQAQGVLSALGVQQLDTWNSIHWQIPGAGTGDVVLTVDPQALRILPAYGLSTVAPAYPDPFLPDQDQRWRDSRSFFSGSTAPARRLALLEHYRVRWVIAAPGQLPSQVDLVLQGSAVEPGNLRLYRVTRPGAYQ